VTILVATNVDKTKATHQEKSNSPDSMIENQLIVFLKAPRPGAVKTRLASTLGIEAACATYRQLVDTLLNRITSVDSVTLCFAPDEAESEIQPWLRQGWRATAQGQGDLGERLDRAFQIAFANGAKRVLIIGSDCPDITVADLDAGWSALEFHDVVLGPATDGGYWLIGLKLPQNLLFREIPWSSSLVLQTTLARCGAARLRVQMLRMLSDIDTEEDWLRFIARPDNQG
jgi:rSAM/selenodomain-associated transferase 1